MPNAHSHYQAKAILLDNDETAVGSDAIHLMTFNQIAQSMNGSGLSESDWWEHCPGGYGAIWRLLVGKEIDLSREFDIGEADFTALAKETYYKNLDCLKPREGIGEMLESYRSRGMLVAIVSGSSSRLIEKGLEVTGLKAHVNAVFGHDAIKALGGRSKSTPDPYLLAAEQIGIAPNQCVVFEDSRRGCKSAHDAGMPVFQLRHSPSLNHVTALSPHAAGSSILPRVSEEAWVFPEQALAEFHQA